MSVKTTGGDLLTTGVEIEGINPSSSLTSHQAFSTFHVINRNLIGSASHGQRISILTESNRENFTILSVKFPDQSRLIGNLHLSGAVHHVVIGNSLGSTNHHGVARRMAGNGSQFSVQKIDIFDKGPIACIG